MVHFATFEPHKSCGCRNEGHEYVQVRTGTYCIPEETTIIKTAACAEKANLLLLHASSQDYCRCAICPSYSICSATVALLEEQSCHRDYCRTTSNA